MTMFAYCGPPISIQLPTYIAYPTAFLGGLDPNTTGFETDPKGLVNILPRKTFSTKRQGAHIVPPQNNRFKSFHNTGRSF